MKAKIFSLLSLLTLLALSGMAAGQAPAPSIQATPTPTPLPLYLPLVVRGYPSAVSTSEWTQHAHDAQHTGYAPQVPPHPWRLRWIWNGTDAAGGVAKVTTTGSLPRNVQPVTGGGRVYVAAGTDGVFALSEATGQRNCGSAVGSAMCAPPLPTTPTRRPCSSSRPTAGCTNCAF